MTQEINLVQGFKGDYPYTLNFNGITPDISNATVRFNFTDRRENKRYSILCRESSSPNEVIIPFTNQTTDYGDFFGEFVIKSSTRTDIYPITYRILVKIRKCI